MVTFHRMNNLGKENLDTHIFRTIKASSGVHRLVCTYLGVEEEGCSRKSQRLGEGVTVKAGRGGGS